MPQVSLYIDKETLSKIEELAHKNKTSLSKWVGNRLKQLIKEDYPEDFFSTFGSISDDSFVEPPDLRVDSDSARVSL